MLDVQLEQASPAMLGLPFDPAALFAEGEAGAYYDPSDLSTMSQNFDGTGAAALGLPVGRIADKSGNGHHATQPAAVARPILRQDSGGLYYLEFDGVDDKLDAGFAISQPWERISAVRQVNHVVGARLFGSPSGAGQGELLQATPSPNLQISSGALLGGIVGAAIGSNAIVTERHNGASSRAAVGNGDYVTGDAGLNVPDGIVLAGRAAAAGWSHIHLYGILMIGRLLTDAEIARLRLFMAAKAGVAF